MLWLVAACLLTIATSSDEQRVGARDIDALLVAIQNKSVSTIEISGDIQMGGATNNAQMTFGLKVDRELTIVGSGKSRIGYNQSATLVATVFNVSEGGTLTIVGVDIHGGRVNGTAGGGGCLQVEQGGKLRLYNLTVTNCSAKQYGGGLYSNGNVELQNVTLSSHFAGDSSGAYGGAIYTSGNMSLQNVRIEKSTARSKYNLAIGGGIYVAAGILDMVDVQCTDVNASTEQGDYSLGGCVGTPGGDVRINISKLTAVNCKAIAAAPNGMGGAIATLAGSLTVTDSHFRNCSATTGADIYTESTLPVVIQKTTFERSADASSVAIDTPGKMTLRDVHFLHPQQGTVSFFTSTEFRAYSVNITKDCGNDDMYGLINVAEGVQPFEIGLYDLSINGSRCVPILSQSTISLSKCEDSSSICNDLTTCSTRPIDYHAANKDDLKFKNITSTPVCECRRETFPSPRLVSSAFAPYEPNGCIESLAPTLTLARKKLTTTTIYAQHTDACVDRNLTLEVDGNEWSLLNETEEAVWNASSKAHWLQVSTEKGSLTKNTTSTHISFKVCPENLDAREVFEADISLDVRTPSWNTSVNARTSLSFPVRLHLLPTKSPPTLPPPPSPAHPPPSGTVELHVRPVPEVFTCQSTKEMFQKSQTQCCEDPTSVVNNIVAVNASQNFWTFPLPSSWPFGNDLYSNGNTDHPRCTVTFTGTTMTTQPAWGKTLSYPMFKPSTKLLIDVNPATRTYTYKKGESYYVDIHESYQDSNNSVMSTLGVPMQFGRVTQVLWYVTWTEAFDAFQWTIKLYPKTQADISFFKELNMTSHDSDRFFTHGWPGAGADYYAQQGLYDDIESYRIAPAVVDPVSISQRLPDPNKLSLVGGEPSRRRLQSECGASNDEEARMFAWVLDNVRLPVSACFVFDTAGFYEYRNGYRDTNVTVDVRPTVRLVDVFGEYTEDVVPIVEDVVHVHFDTWWIERNETDRTLTGEMSFDVYSVRAPEGDDLGEFYLRLKVDYKWNGALAEHIEAGYGVKGERIRGEEKRSRPQKNGMMEYDFRVDVVGVDQKAGLVGIVSDGVPRTRRVFGTREAVFCITDDSETSWDCYRVDSARNMCNITAVGNVAVASQMYATKTKEVTLTRNPATLEKLRYVSSNQAMLEFEY